MTDVQRSLGPCTCEWDPGDGYTTPPSPITVCEFCEGGMAERHRVSAALNAYRANHPERAEAVRHAMEHAALNPWTRIESERTSDDRIEF